MSEARHQRAALTALWSALLLWAVGLAWVAIRLPLDNWDGFEFIANARLIAGQAAAVSRPYSFVRPPLLSLLLAPLQWSYQPCGRALWQPHLLAVLIAVLSVLAGYQLFRASFGLAMSAVGAAALALNALTVHYAPFAMADLLSMLLAAVALRLWLGARARPGWSRFALAGMTAGLAAAAKYPLLLLTLALALFELARATLPGEGRPLLRRRLQGLLEPGPWLAGLVSAACFGLAWLFAALLAIPHLSWARLAEAARSLFQQTGAVYLDPWWEYFETSWLLLGLPWLACAAMGLVESCRARRDDDLLHLVWLSTYLAVMSGWMGHKEARYLLPALPSLLFLGLRGARLASAALSGYPALRWLGAALLLAIPTMGAAGEARRFARPVYTQPVLAEASCFALAGVGPRGRVIVSGGRAWSLFSVDPVIFPHDEVFHFHHISRVAIEYFVGRRLSGAAALQGPDPVARVQIPLGWYTTENVESLPPSPKPLRVTIFRRERQAGATASAAQREDREFTLSGH